MNTDQLASCTGMSPKEAAAYITLVQLGPQAASTLAKLTSVNRTTIYDIINSLQKKGLILSYTEGKNTFYFVDNIHKLLQHQEQQLQQTRQVIEDLEHIISREQTGVQYFMGEAGLRSIYDMILRVKPDELLGWMDLDVFYSYFHMDEAFDQSWTNERIRLGIYARLLLQESPMTVEFSSHDHTNFRTCHLVKKNIYAFDTACFLYGNYACIIDPMEKGVGIVISNPRIMSFLRNTFNLLWKAHMA